MVPLTPAAVVSSSAFREWQQQKSIIDIIMIQLKLTLLGELLLRRYTPYPYASTVEKGELQAHPGTPQPWPPILGQLSTLLFFPRGLCWAVLMV